MNRPMSAGLITTDAAFREAITKYAEEGGGFKIVLDFKAPFTDIADRDLKKIQLAQPQVIFLDLDHDPQLGCQFAEYLVQRHPATRIVVASEGRASDVLIQAMHAGVSEFVEKPVDRESLDHAVERLQRRVAAQPEARPGGRVFALFGAKGGTGTTTVSTNLAIHLARNTDARTLLVDLDLEMGEASVFLGLEPRYSLADLARSFDRLDDGLLRTYLEHHSSGLDVLAAPLYAEDAEGIKPDDVRRILRFLRRRYDYIVVDASNALTARTLAALDEADETLILTQVDVPSLRNVQRARHALDRLGRRERSVRLLVNRFDARSPIKLAEVRTTLDMDVFWTLSNDYDAVIYAINAGEPVALTVPSTPAAEIAGLVEKLTGVEVQKTRSAGLFARFRGRSRAGKQSTRAAASQRQPLAIRPPQPIDDARPTAASDS